MFGRNKQDVDHAKEYASLISEAAKHHRGDVARGAESAPLAVALLHQFGRGVYEAAVLALGVKAAAPIRKALDDSLALIDPSWNHVEAERHKARPAGLSFGQAEFQGGPKAT
jgi:hypothetical protein